MKHDDLVQRAAVWAKKTRRCVVTLSEIKTLSGPAEIPDVIGWQALGHSVLIEVKVSRADFLADKNKPFRTQPHLGMGDERWFAVPDDVKVEPEDMPHGWGLVRFTAERARVLREPSLFTPNQQAATILLVNALQRATDGWSRKVFGPDAPDVKPEDDLHPRARASRARKAKREAKKAEGGPSKLDQIREMREKQFK